jgi:predicted metalloprotease with PDZ domain
MRKPVILPLIRGAVLLLAALATSTARAQGKKLDQLMYTISVPDPASKTISVKMVVPIDIQDSVILMMPIWGPGMYRLQNYGNGVAEFTAKGADGAPLGVTKPRGSRWVIQTGKQPTITVEYTVRATRGSNLSNGVTDSSLVVIGPATYLSLVEPGRRPSSVQLDLPTSWKSAVTSLDAAPDGKPNHFVAPDYDILADSPIIAGVHLSSAEFTVGGNKHYWVYLGDSKWGAENAAKAMTPLMEEHLRFWGKLPFKKYVFLNIITGAGGGSGIEHLNSVAITGGGSEPATQQARFRNAAFISHEYFHAMNVKRLRPVELGPFDYENTPATMGLWVGEGLTSYFGDLLAERSGIGTPQDWLATTSGHITSLQTSPGRLMQTVEQASAQMFENLPRNQTVDYYVKGPVVGLILEAHIRKMTNDKKSMDDVVHLEYKRWSGEHGYTEEQFAQTAADAVGFDIKPLMHKLVATTEEVDYTEMLDWFGLRFIPNADPTKAWALEERPEATPAQKAHFASFMAHSKGP